MMIQPACRRVSLLLIIASCSATACSGGSAAVSTAPNIKTTVLDTMALPIHGIYRSMDGPMQRVALDPTGIGWITRFRTEVIDVDTEEQLGDELFCHSQIQLATSARVVVTAMGISDMVLPEGYGIPLAEILGDMEEPWRSVSVLGMVLNNHDPDMNRQVKIRFTIDYIEETDPAVTAMKTLYKASIPVVPDDEVHGAFERSSAVVLAGDPLQPTGEKLSTPHGKVGHWMVPPGKQVIRQRYRKLIGVPTRVHYGLVHLHNHGRSMKLTDVTEGKVLWETEVVYEPERVQITEIPVYSSIDGFVIYPDHEYEIESVYDNTSSEIVDAMAVMYLYHAPVNGERISFPVPKNTTPEQVEAEQQHH